MAMQIKRAISENPEIRLIIFPELSITGYFLSPNLIKLSDKCDGLLFEKMGLLARKYDVWIVYGYVERDGGTIYNSIQLVDPTGKSAANYRKIHLTPLERGIFSPGNEIVAAKSEIGNIGLMICWDLAFPELARALAIKGANLLVAPSAWERPYERSYQQFAAARAIDNTVYLATSNHISKSGRLSFFGHSSIFAPDGSTIVKAGSEETLLTASLNENWRKELQESFFTMLNERRLHF